MDRRELGSGLVFIAFCIVTGCSMGMQDDVAVIYVKQMKGNDFYD